MRTLTPSIFILLTPLLSQHPAIEQPPEEIPANPSSKPLPRRLVGVGPLTLYRDLMSSSKDERTRALRRLGDNFSETDRPEDTRLYALNLDSDPDLEYVLEAKVAFAATIAWVFKKGPEGWWMVGEFLYSWHWDANQAERFIEFREIVTYGRKEIIVRDTGGGTGFAETRLAIYRMNNGFLYRVFETTEDGFSNVVGTGTAEYEHRDIEYPDPDGADGHTFLIVRLRKHLEDGPDHKKPEIRACSPFSWDAVFFRFAEDKAAATTVCKKQATR
jgi:hypothetical protein